MENYNKLNGSRLTVIRLFAKYNVILCSYNSKFPVYRLGVRKYKYLCVTVYLHRLFYADKRPIHGYLLLVNIATLYELVYSIRYFVDKFD